MEILYSRFEELFEQFLEKLPELLFALIVLILFHFLARGGRKIYKNLLDKTPLTSSNINFFGKLIYVFIFLIGILIALNILGLSGIATSILASGGITAVILGFAFKDIGENFLAGFFMAFSRPFTNGDLIETEGVVGRVQNIELRHTHVRMANGCDVFVPSSQLLAKPLYNYTRDGLRRGSFSIGIDYRDDAQKACQILLEVIKANEQAIDKPEPMVQTTGFTPNFVELTGYFWIKVDVTKQEIFLANIKSELMDEAREALVQNDFTFSSEVTTAVDMSEVNVRLDDTSKPPK
ncbi:mechanosensitive ion channel family protein [Fodinibius sp.]|uniref:mechanosensitive ion channel family protein n=1 Tax=Fodinibius sp. TaxID=1872440 RepID=UPI002ACE03FA|nr:mechanosensitive ion channel domain-containing protein [Fodinibius sp.]MDZ7658336.1 mechanosensitive ion channel [Fodinibius sp.]